MMASSTVPSTSPCYRSRKKPPVLPPASVPSFSDQVDQLSQAKPPPVPKRRSKSANYYHASGKSKLASVSSASIASCSAEDFNLSTLTAIAAGKLDDSYQDPDKVTTIENDMHLPMDTINIMIL